MQYYFMLKDKAQTSPLTGHNRVFPDQHHSPFNIILPRFIFKVNMDKATRSETSVTESTPTRYIEPRMLKTKVTNTSRTTPTATHLILTNSRF